MRSRADAGGSLDSSRKMAVFHHRLLTIHSFMSENRTKNDTFFHNLQVHFIELRVGLVGYS